MATRNEKLKKQAQAARSVLAAVRRSRARKEAGAGVSARSLELRAAAVRKDVAFACTLAGALVGITCDDRDFAFNGAGASSFRQGHHDLFYRLTGGPENAKFTLTASGGATLKISKTTDGSGQYTGYDILRVK